MSSVTISLQVRSAQPPDVFQNSGSPQSPYSKQDRPIRLCVITTIGKSIQFIYPGRFEYLMAHGFDVTVCCAASELDGEIRARGLRLATFPLTRAITPWDDFRALVQIRRFLAKQSFDIVEVSTPKAALIGSMAAWLARSPCIVHVAHGLAYEGKSGLLGALLRLSIRIPCSLAHITFAVSPSVREQICANGLGTLQRIHVLGAGSANGIDLDRFSPEKRELGRGWRTANRILPNGVVIGFVGRHTRDKGIEELVEAFVLLRQQFSDIVLLVVGDYEARDQPPEKTKRVLATHEAVRHVGWQTDVVPFMAAMDIFVLPTYREGLGTVLLEAAAMGIPTVTTKATGARDAIVDGTTGFAVPIAHVGSLAEALARLIQDASLRDAIGRAGCEWVSKHFDRREVWRLQAEEYRSLLSGAKV